VQYAKPKDNVPPLGREKKKYTQQVPGTFLFYEQAASEQANPTEATMKKCKQFLDFVASQEESISTYLVIDMVLAIHRNTSNCWIQRRGAEPEGTIFWIAMRSTQKIMGQS